MEPSERPLGKWLGNAGHRVALALSVLVLAGCSAGPGTREADPITPDAARALIERAIPPPVKDRGEWAVDIYVALAAMEIQPTPENVCAVVAVTDQESNFQADPPVPGLADMAWREIDERSERLGISKKLVRTLLRANSPAGISYAKRIDAAKTERELSEIFEDLIGVMPGGDALLSDRNPVRTGGPMQVSIAFAERYADDHAYPYPVEKNLRAEVFTRRGGMYFGIAHLLDYPADYEQPIFRFADYNAGHYASRNAGFQNALSILSGIPLDLDGDLIRIGTPAPGSTEMAARTLGKRLKMSDSDIRDDLERGTELKFQKSDLYEKVFELADAATGQPLPRAVVPRITLKSPKITRQLTTDWFATRVQQRHERCLERVASDKS